jgi:hypothetical protein
MSNALPKPADGQAAELPPTDFDPITHPILAQHWYSVEIDNTAKQHRQLAVLLLGGRA